MKGGMMKGLLAGMLIGTAAATAYGVMNWQTERKWNQAAKRTGSWISNKAGNLAGKM